MAKVRFADDDTQSVSQLFRFRFPSLLLGLLLGVALSFVTSRFGEVLAENISVAFFIPFVVYMAAAVGAQTQNIYARDLRSGRASFWVYFVKEAVLGLFFGLIFGIISGVIVFVWHQSIDLTLAVALSIFGAIASAPLIALTVTEVLELEHTDPAAGAGPIATVIQDTVSVLIYGFIASSILLT